MTTKMIIISATSTEPTIDIMSTSCGSNTGVETAESSGLNVDTLKEGLMLQYKHEITLSSLTGLAPTTL